MSTLSTEFVFVIIPIVLVLCVFFSLTFVLLESEDRERLINLIKIFLAVLIAALARRFLAYLLAIIIVGLTVKVTNNRFEKLISRLTRRLRI